MNSFSLLSKEMQKKIWEMGWTHFTPIQEQAIPAIIKTNHDVILSSGTASGKTEAAFLPILSMISNEAEKGLKVIYVSPLKALINNQFNRLTSLTESLDIPIHRWHGDIDQGKKLKFTKNPSGILQITPESIESLFINRTSHLHTLFSSVEFIVIDEIHAFLDNERGVQLRSLLSRMKGYCSNKPRIIGLSATIGDMDFAKKWVNFNAPESVEVVEAKNSEKELFYHLMHIDASDDGKTPLELFEDIRELTRDTRSIIFCNSRGMVEEATVFLNRLAAKEGIEETYFAHHSSIDKKEREFVEKILSESTEPKSIVATSSLELGIDIGSIDLVVQIDSTYTVSSLKQRLGRSGRGKDKEQILQLYSTEEDGMLQALAVMELNLEKWMEPFTGYKIPFDLLFHQLLSICGENNGLRVDELMERVKHNQAFNELNEGDILHLIEHMTSKHFLEEIKGSREIIVGIEGERIMRSKEFYAVFSTEEVFEVIHGSRKMGEFDKQFTLDVGDHVMLTGKLWRVIDIDTTKNKIYVEKANNAKKPKYFGGPVALHPKIPEKMFEILTGEQEFDYVNIEANQTLSEMRKKYRIISAKSGERIIWNGKEEQLFEIFSGSKIVNTIQLMLRCLGIPSKKPDSFGRVYVSNEVDLLTVLQMMKERSWKEEELLSFVEDNELFSSKFSPFIPKVMRLKMHAEHVLDLNGTMEYLSRLYFRFIND